MILNDGFGKLEVGMMSSLVVRLGTTTISLIVDPVERLSLLHHVSLTCFAYIQPFRSYLAVLDSCTI